MTNIVRIALMVAILVPAAALAQEAERLARQAELDAACEAARQVRIREARAEYIEECVEKKQRPDRASCERFYSDYGESPAGRAPLFYDLPECVAANEFRRSYRSADN